MEWEEKIDFAKIHRLTLFVEDDPRPIAPDYLKKELNDIKIEIVKIKDSLGANE